MHFKYDKNKIENTSDSSHIEEIIFAGVDINGKPDNRFKYTFMELGMNLVKLYVDLANEFELNEFCENSMFHEFRVKLIYMYQKLNDIQGNKVAYKWVCSFFTGYTEKELFELYKRFQFTINQLLNIKESIKALPAIEARALIYQGILWGLFFYS